MSDNNDPQDDSTATSSSSRRLAGATGTLLGPLTTLWGMPMTCTQLMINDELISGPGYGIAMRAAHCSNSRVRSINPDCWPPRKDFRIEPDYQTLSSGWGFYSPGLVCPQDHTQACTATFGGEADWPPQFQLVEGETAIGCCPKGYICPPSSLSLPGNLCLSSITTNGHPVAFCESTLRPPDLNGLNITSTLAPPQETETTVYSTIFIAAPMFQLNFRSEDLEAFSTGGVLSEIPRETAAVNTDDDITGDTQAGLSTPTIIGIAAGAGSLFILVCITAFFLLWRRRKTSEAESSPSASPSSSSPTNKPKTLEDSDLYPPPSVLLSRNLTASPLSIVDLEKNNKVTEFQELEACYPGSSRGTIVFEMDGTSSAKPRSISELPADP